MEVFKKKVTTDFFLKKYHTTNFGAEHIGYIAFTEEKFPAAFYGVIPCHFKIDDKIFLAAQSVDTMTHRDHQRRGLFMQLAEKTYEAAKQEGVQFIFGFPNQNSYAGFVKLKWEFLPHPMQYFVLKGSKLPLAVLLLKIPLLRKVYHLYEERMVSELTIQNLGGDRSGENGVMRNPLFLQYKAQYTKTFVKKWPSMHAWMKNDGILKVGLIYFDKTISPEVIVDHLSYTAKILGCRSVVLMTSRHSELYDLLINITTPRKGLPIGFYNLTNEKFQFDKIGFEYCDLDTF
jgi:hypothetical protein